MSKYFISYAYSNVNSSGNGNLEISLSGGISSIADIGEIEQKIMQENDYFRASITNFIEIMPDYRCEEGKIAEARSDMKEEILTYLRDCRDDLGCPGAERRVLNKFIDNIDNLIDV